MFAFGIMATLDSVESMISLYMVIVFIILFNFATGLLEFCLEDFPLYNRMVQNIYKELMQMGIVSFIFLLYQSSSNSTPSHETETWLISVDFAHILLFFVALFFVLHAFFLMGTSFLSSAAYVKMYCKNVFHLIEAISEMSWLDSVLFHTMSFSLSTVRQDVEFKIMHALFRDTYFKLPENFNFSLYLAKCFERYALNTLEVGIFSWVTVIILVAVNFVRLRFHGPFSCVGEVSTSTDSPGHVNLDSVSRGCYFEYMELFFVCAVILCVYIVIVLIVARIYEQRFVGFFLNDMC